MVSIGKKIGMKYSFFYLNKILDLDNLTTDVDTHVSR